MGAPKGNEYWKRRSTHGREKIFTDPEVFKQACYEYFQSVDETPLFAVEQRRAAGSHIIPEGATPEERAALLDPLIKIPRMVPYTIQGLCIFLDVNTRYFGQFETQIGEELLSPNKLSKEIVEEFSCTLMHVRDIIYQNKFNGTAAGFFNPAIMVRDKTLGLADSKEVTGKDGAPLNPVPSINVVTVESIHIISEDSDEDETE